MPNCWHRVCVRQNMRCHRATSKLRSAYRGLDEQERKTPMNASVTEVPERLKLCAETAAALMTPDPLSIREDATVHEAVSFLTDNGFSAAPVVDKAGRPVGVLSRADII